ncbi:MAG: hypothetical protein FWD22_05480, partial [Treponema sp.]|nr:hypothetical protein [Treponema sp.]
LTCKFDIPTAIEIKGTPSFSFTGNFDTGDFLREMLDDLLDAGDSEEYIRLYDCINTPSVFTMMAAITLYDEEFYFESDNLAAIQLLFETGMFDDGIPLDNPVFDVTNFPFFADTVEMPDLDLSEFLGDFIFDGYEAHIYISGHDILTLLDINIHEQNFSRNNPSNLESSPLVDGNKYLGTSMPAGGAPITILIDNDLEEINVDIGLSLTGAITQEMLAPGNVKIELVVWLPFRFVAPTGGEWDLFDFSSDEGEDDDLLGRSYAGDSSAIGDIVESLYLEVKLSGFPLDNSTLQITNGTFGTPDYINIPVAIGSNSLVFNFSAADMAKINNSYPFAPEIKVVMNPGAELYIPRNLMMTELAFKAKIKYRIEL